MALVLLSVDFPVVLPLGDLSTVIKGRTPVESHSRGAQNKE